ncbi:helix-turn-helix transcriptional regulator [Kibdelosporangium aridum]|uniref:helix-turn-helix transcriptional regulator n=1 Tax=Kibdelosporangium aridum TaxID=2030 RepID=UPI0021ADE6BE|nr:helix-turn-helix transcriptional regulator [Kibdelosporangium aridum]
MAKQCRDWAQRHGDQAMLAYALFIQGSVTRFRGDFRRAQALLEDALARFESSGELNTIVVIAPDLVPGWRPAPVRLPALDRPASGVRAAGPPRPRRPRVPGRVRLWRRPRPGSGLDRAVAYALGEKPASATPTLAGTGTAGTSLTRRERQVAELVAEGLSNKDIAARLVIAQRTAEGHVARILTKLGFTTRTQLAAWVINNKKAETGDARSRLDGILNECHCVA